jgi:AbiV family abortive infection protein
MRKRLPTPNDALAGSRFALTNARRHLRAAKVLDESGLTGAAMAHVVLSLEEFAKAWTLTLLSFDVDIPKNLVGEILKYHNARHSFTLVMLFFAVFRSMGIRAGRRVQKRHGVSDYPPELRDEYVAELAKDVDSLRLKTKRDELGFAMIEWIAQANDFKNRGLYVDFDGKKWIHPGRISHKDYAIGYRIAVELIKRLGPFISGVYKHNLNADAEFKELIASQLKKQSTSSQDPLADLIRIALNTL